MKFRFEIAYRLGLVLLLIMAFWSVWASAQPSASTNQPPARRLLPFINPGGGTNEFETPTFGLDNVDFLTRHEALGQPLWKYAASLIYIVLAFGVAWLLDVIVAVWLHRVSARTKTPYDDLLLKLLRGPLKLVAFIILLNIGLGLFDWPARAQLLLSRGLIVVVAFSVTYLATKIADLLLNLWREKIVLVEDRALAEQLIPLLAKLAKVLIIFAAAVVTAENLDIKITSLLAGFSIGGLALGLAAQDTVANLFGAVAIFLDKPFHLGDLIKIEGADGTVESIGLRSTRIRNADGHHVTVPNKLMGNAIITNITRRPAIRTEMNLGLAYDTPVEKVKQATVILQDILRSNPNTANLIVSFNKFTDSALNIFVVHIWSGTDAKEHFAQMQEWNLKIKERFEAEGIELAFPTQTIHLKTGAGK
jgi:MscS family membrane protein